MIDFPKLKDKIVDYASLVKFAHTVFALPFAMVGFFMAWREHPDIPVLQLLVAVILCMFFARNAAMSFNRWADWRIDQKNPRTISREIPAGKINPKQALFFCVLNCVLFIATTWFINRLCFFLSPVALFVVLGYSFTKRFTSLAHFVLGLGLGLAPIGAYLAVTGKFEVTPLLLSVAVFLWTAGFDIIYALQDEDFDKTQGLRSIPALLGVKRALRLSLVVHLLSILFVVGVGISGQFHYLYWMGVVAFSALIARQHLIVKPDDLRRVNAAFFTANGMASILFAAFAISDFLLL